MYAVGVDVSKGKSMVAVVAPLGKVVSQPFEVRHTSTELAKLIQFLKTLDGEVRVVMEHTGRYYESIALVLHNAGFFVSAVNPLLIAQYGNNSIRKVKTDKADALKIAKYTLDNWPDLRRYTPIDNIRYELKTLNHQYLLYTKIKTAEKCNLIELLEQAYPGANQLFTSPARKDGSQKWVDFVCEFWHVDCVRNQNQSAFVKKYHKWCVCHGYQFNEGKAIRIYTKAKELVALVPKSATTQFMIKQAVSQLLSTSRAVEAARAEMLRLASQLPEYPLVISMYGVGPTTGPQLIAEIGDIRRFTGKRALVAYAGVDPSVNQSGMHVGKSGSATKRGSPYLRKTLFMIMTTLMQHFPAEQPVYQFLDRKRTEGKPYYVYMTAGANKFLRIYYGKVRDYLAGLHASQRLTADVSCEASANP